MRVRRTTTAGVSAALGLGLALGLAVAPHAAMADPDAVKEAQAKVAALQEESSRLDLEHTRLTEKLSKADKRISTLETDVTGQREKVKGLKRSLAKVAAAQYQQSGLGMTAKLLSQPDDTSMLKQMVTVENASQRANRRVQSMQAEQAKLTSMESSLKKSRDQVKADKDKQAELLKQYDKKIDEAEKVVERLTAEEKARLKRLQEEAAKRQMEEVRRQDAQREAEQVTVDEDRSQSDRTPGAPKRNADGKTQSNRETQSEQDTPPTSSRGAAAAVAYARAQVGKPYVSGAAGPNAFDCSGLTSAAWRQAGVSLPRTSQGQAGAGVRVSLNNIQPGDIVVFYSGASHVGIYVGNGMLVDAANPRKGVRMISLSNSWMPIHSIRRVG